MTYIVQDIWRKILGKTDLLTCLNFSDIEAAEPFLTDPQAAMDIAIAANHWMGVRLLLRHGVGILSADTAARHGHLDLLKWICEREDSLDINEDTISTTAANGHLHVLQWIFETFTWTCFEDTNRLWLMNGFESFGRAMENGQLDVARWLLSIRHQTPPHLQDYCNSNWTKWTLLAGYTWTDDWDNYVEDILARCCEHPAVFRWLITEAQLDLGLDKLGFFGMRAALVHGRFEYLEWLQAQFPSFVGPWSRTTWDAMIIEPSVYYAIVQGHLECVLWICALSTKDFVVETLHKYLENPETSIILYHISGNRDHDKSLAMMRWLHDTLGKFTGSQIPHPTTAAASSGNIKLLRYFKEIGFIAAGSSDFGWALDLAAHNGHLHVIQWLQQEGLDHGSIEAPVGAAYNGHLQVLKWLHVDYVELFSHESMEKASVSAAAAGHLDVLKWMHHTCHADFSSRAMDFAAGEGKLDIVKWLHDCETAEGATTDAMDGALKGRHYDVAIWLQANRSEGCSEHVLEDLFKVASHCNTMVPFNTYDFLKQYYPEKLDARFESYYSLEAWLHSAEQQFQKLHL